MATDNAQLSDRLYWIDTLRGLAALMIVIFHYHHFYLRDYLDRPALPPISEFPYAFILEPMYSEWAAKAVQLFWMISGIVFLHVYRDRSTGFWSFSVARFARLYPLHFATLLFVAIVQAISIAQAGHWQVYGNNDTRHFLLNLFFASNSTTLARGLSFNGPIWSVSLEIPVYVMFFLALSFLKRAPLIASGLALAGSIAVANGLLGDISPVDKGVFGCAGYFFLGTMLYALYRSAHAKGGLIVALFGLCGALIAVGVATATTAVLVAGVAAFLALGALMMERIMPVPDRKNWLGDLSYAIYLVHVPLQMAFLLSLDLFFSANRSVADSLWLLPIYVGVTLAVSHFVHHGFEVPIGQKIRTSLLVQKTNSKQKEVPHDHKT